MEAFSSLKRVLVVDDNPVGLELAEAALKSLGCELLYAGDGEEALQKVRACLPDLVLLDLRLPKLNGFAVVAQMRRDSLTVGICVVALTASGMNGDREKALASGFDGYITKPIGVAALRHDVMAWLNRPATPAPRAAQ